MNYRWFRNTGGGKWEGNNDFGPVFLLFACYFSPFWPLKITMHHFARLPDFSINNIVQQRILGLLKQNYVEMHEFYDKPELSHSKLWIAISIGDRIISCMSSSSSHILNSLSKSSLLLGGSGFSSSSPSSSSSSSSSWKFRFIRKKCDSGKTLI